MPGLLLSTALLAASAAGLVSNVRQALNRNDFPAAEKILQEAQDGGGVTGEWLEAHSWMGRASLAAKDLEKALSFAAQTRKMALAQLQRRKLDDERHLPIALGASIEVHAQATAARGERAEAVAFLRRELEAWRATSIRTRIQKNLNILSLAGQPAPGLDVAHSLGGPTPSLAALRGRPVLLFFWAHWCGDCRAEVPALVRITKEFASQGLVVIGPTQHYGYVARGQEAPPERETAYIEETRRVVYGAIPGLTVPISQETFKVYGASTTPTLVLLDRQGLVRLYWPGKMTYQELAGHVRQVVGK